MYQDVEDNEPSSRPLPRVTLGGLFSSLRARLIVGGLVAIVLPLVIFTWIAIGLLWQFYLRELEAELRVHANLIAQMSAYVLAPETPDDPQALATMVDRWQATTNMRLTLCDLEGVIQAAPSGDQVNKRIDEEHQPGMMEAVQGHANATVWKSPNFGYEDTMYVNLPVRLNGRLVGAVRVAYTVSQIRNKVLLIQDSLAATLAGYAVLIITLIGLLGAALVKPVEKLSDDARELARGNLDHRVEARGFREIRNLAVTLDNMRQRLQNLEYLRRRRVSDVSHEIRTPLASIRAMAETLLAHGADDPSIREKYLKRIVEQTDRLASFATQILDLDQIEARKIRFVLAPEDCCKIIETALHTVEQQARARGIRLEWRAPAGLPPVMVEAERAAQIFVNLLENAVRHTPAGGAIRLEAIRDGEAVAVSVADTGCGIPARHLPHIFERFYRVDENRAPGTGGVGLGLCIVRETVMGMGGEVTVTSEEHRGTRFTVKFPLASMIGVR